MDIGISSSEKESLSSIRLTQPPNNKNMKKQNQTQSSSATRRTASAKLILTGMIAAVASFALPASSHAQISTQDFTLDGNFTGGFTVGGGPIGEWSDVTPFSFISSPSGTIPVSNVHPDRNTQLYAAISHNVASAPGDLQLHLMYDFLPRTQIPLPGEIFATVTFPVTLGGPFAGRPKDDISVILQGNGLPSFFDIFVDLEVNNPLNGLTPLRLNGLNTGLFPGLLAATSPGGSPLSATPHLRVELEVSLRIQPSQVTPGGPLPGGGINPATGMYDPDPVFWGAAAGADGQGALAGDGKGGPASFGEGLQNATTVIIGINGDGSLAVTPTPEPTTAALLVFGSLAMLGARRRKSSPAT